MTSSDHELSDFDQAAEQAIGLANRLLEQDDQVDRWEIASGLLAGAVHFWLYACQPCGDLFCESCSEVDTADKRLRKLLEEITKSAEESDYFHSPYDANIGRA